MESSADCSSQPPGSGALPSGMTPIFVRYGRLLARQLGQLADRFVKRAVRALAQQVGHLGPAVGEEVVDVAELVVAGAEPLLVRLHAHQRAHVAPVVDVPGRRVAVLLARQAGRHRVEVGALPERRRQLLESERQVEALRALDDVLGRRPLEQRDRGWRPRRSPASSAPSGCRSSGRGSASGVGRL